MARFPYEELDDIITPLRSRIEVLEFVLRPSSETKAAYSGEFATWGCDECGDVTVEWRTIKEILKFIRDYAEQELDRRESLNRKVCSD